MFANAIWVGKKEDIKNDETTTAIPTPLPPTITTEKPAHGKSKSEREK